MPPEETNAGDPQNNQQGDGSNKPDGKYNPSSVEEALKIIGALSKRVDERDADLEKTKRELAGYSTAQREQLKEQGKFRELAEQSAAEVARLKAFEEKATHYEKVTRESNEARMEKVPDAMKSLIPTNYTPFELQTWLNANEALLVKPPAPDYDAGKGQGSGGSPLPKLTDMERELAKAMRVTEKQYAELKQQRGQPIELVKKPTTP